MDLDRTEAFMSDAHGRDHVTKASWRSTPTASSWRCGSTTLANMGAYLSTFAPCVPTYLYATLLAGVYTTPVIYAEVKAVFTNTVPVDAYRGAGRPEATFLLERVVDMAAREIGIDPVEIRRQELHPKPTHFPYQTPVALQYDSGDYHATLDKALEIADWAGFEARRAASDGASGKLRGIGISTYVEACGIAPSAVVGPLGARAGLYESRAPSACTRPAASPSSPARHSHGQGHETTFAQLVADRARRAAALRSRSSTATPRKMPFGMGTYGSRSLAVGGSAIMVKAMDKIIAKAQADRRPPDGGLGRGRRVRRTAPSGRRHRQDRVAWARSRLAAYVPHNYPIDELEPGLEETAFYDPKNFTYPGGCPCCEVEIDRETGHRRGASTSPRSTMSAASSTR